jgi:hypothetical protein
MNIPTDFLITSDVGKWKAAISVLLTTQDSTFSHFSTQFLTNGFLQNQLNAIFDPMMQLDEIVKASGFKGIKIGDIQRISHPLEKLAGLVTITITFSIATRRTTLVNEKLQNDLEVNRIKLQVANNDLILKQNESGQLQFFAIVHPRGCRRAQGGPTKP